MDGQNHNKRNKYIYKTKEKRNNSGTVTFTHTQINKMKECYSKKLSFYN